MTNPANALQATKVVSREQANANRTLLGGPVISIPAAYLFKETA